ncbi:hypothetical protein C4K68_00780 [Pokkaliibacter plantistimulans]|uniref:Uncharacterized protein n=1 Tax=Proteobacteria bacterium 228 TaxID=2083153 RepID=A0A2S5KXA6_9PROT|nr:hypothetical protein [Pokkaliibacter plantistimulans]PPC79272.1 hypothetical protein C4K68_00780 [Pokkaliibacter plantistimulans]
MLIDYCQRYQDIYPFELLDRPLLFLRSSALSGVTFRDVQDDLAVAAGEYCSSLNEVAEALLVLTDTGVFGKAQAVKVINHILEAYSCNETVEEFLNREIAYLSGELSALV